MAWYNTNWQYRIKLTVPSSQLTENLTNFPVYLDLSKMPTDFWSKVKSDGGDIRITTSDEITETAREIVFIDITNHKGEVHFKAPSLSISSDNIFYIYFGNPSASDYPDNHTYGANNVYDNYYKGVWHMQNAKDSKNGYNLTANGGVIIGGVDGVIGKATAFDGTDDYLITSTSIGISGASARTVEILVKVNLITVHPHLLEWGAFANNQKFGISVNSPAGNVGTWFLWGYGQGNDWDTGVFVETGIWQHHIIVYNGTTVVWYINNSSLGSFSHTYNTADTEVYIGVQSDYVNWFNGLIDEVRISNIARSNGWIDADYKNKMTTGFLLVSSTIENAPVSKPQNFVLFFGAE